MISPNEFKEKLNKEIYPLINYDEDKVNKCNLPEETKRFLIEAGLPESAAPFLSFESEKEGSLLTLKVKYNIDQYGDGIYIGFTGDGDILAVESKSGVVVCINHETFKKSYVNNSVPQLAESLLEYECFINSINEINGEFAYLDRECPQKQLELIKCKLININKDSLNINKDSLNINTLWWNELSLFE